MKKPIGFNTRKPSPRPRSRTSVGPHARQVIYAPRSFSEDTVAINTSEAAAETIGPVARMHGKRKPEAPKQARSTSARKTRKQTPEAPAPSQTSDSHQQGRNKATREFAVWPDIPPTWELEHDARGHSESPRTFGPVAFARLGDSHAFAPDCCLHRVIPSSASWTQRRGQDTVGPYDRKSCTSRGDVSKEQKPREVKKMEKVNHQTSPSMHVKPDTPPHRSSR